MRGRIPIPAETEKGDALWLRLVMKKHRVVGKSIEGEENKEDDERTSNKFRSFLISSELRIWVVG